MAGTRRLAGVTYITVSGVQYPIADDCTWQPGNLKRETMTGLSGTVGYNETFVPAMIKVKIYDSPDMAVSDWFNFTDELVVVTAANGKFVTGSGMWVTEALSVSGKEGSFEVTFEGVPGSGQVTMSDTNEELQTELEVHFDPALVYNGDSYDSVTVREPTAKQVQLAEAALKQSVNVATMREYQILLVSLVAGIKRGHAEQMPISKLNQLSAFVQGFIDGPLARPAA